MASTDTATGAVSIRLDQHGRVQRSLFDRLKYPLGSTLLILLLLGLWEAAPTLGWVAPIVLPPISKVFVAFGELLATPTFWGHVGVTMNEIFWGFTIGVLLGLIVGTLFGVIPPIKRLTYPMIVALNTVPKIVFAPLFIIWLGYDQPSKIMMGIAHAFFPMFINTMLGIESVPRDALRLMKSLEATTSQTFFKVRVLSAAPILFTGVKTALTFAVIGVIAGEFLGARAGLGYLLDVYQFTLDIPKVFAVILTIGLIGAGLFFIIEWLDKKLIFWAEDRIGS